jgi:glutathione S-transferase
VILTSRNDHLVCEIGIMFINIIINLNIEENKMAIIYGVAPSPFVRKVMLAHAYKNVNYDFKHTLPTSDDEEFRQASPLGKVPAYRTDDGIGFADSSVIIAYLERLSAENTLYPADNNNYALALWLEEYADTKMMDVTGALYFQRIIGPKFFGHSVDVERVAELTEKLIPEVLDFIETKITAQSWLIANELSVADLSVGTNLVNLLHADFAIDASRWPNLSTYNQHFLALDIVKTQLATEQAVFAGAK